MSFFVSWELGESSDALGMDARHVIEFVEDVECTKIGTPKIAARFLPIDEQKIPSQSACITERLWYEI